MDYDVIVIGAGSMGMAAGYYLAKSGKRVLLLDKNDPPHADGSHHGETRIIRHAYGEGEKYVEMALRSQQLWEQLEAEAEKNLFIPTGVVNVGTEKSDFIASVIESAVKHDLPIEKLTAAEIQERWKGFTIPKGYIGCFERTSGVLKSEECIRVYKDIAIQNGAQVRANVAITGMNIEPEDVTVTTDQGEFTSKYVIITAGAGTNQLLSLVDIELPLEETRQTFSWFEHDSTFYESGNFPAFFVESDIGDYYGFPSIEDAGVKIGRHDIGVPRDMKEPIEDFGTYEEDKGDVLAFTKNFMSSPFQHKRGLPCTYTRTPDDDFIIDTLPGHRNAWIACGFSGHGFKFASAVGEELSEMITKGSSTLDLAYFNLKRFN